MAAQIHVAGNTWIRVSRRFVLGTAMDSLTDATSGRAQRPIRGPIGDYSGYLQRFSRKESGDLYQLSSG